MTATTKPPIRERRSHRPIRFFSMETLGFSNPSATWTDSPISIPHTTPATSRRGRHEAPEPEPMTVADWDPEDFGTRLSGRNIRWSIVTMVLMMLCAGCPRLLAVSTTGRPGGSIAHLAVHRSTGPEGRPTDIEDFQCLTLDQ